MTRHLLLLSFAILVPACQRDPESAPANPTGPAATSRPATGHAEPRCVTIDCATGKVTDDGCVEDLDGRRVCASCVLACPGDVLGEAR